MTDANNRRNSKWGAQHYNAIAKEIRELFPENNPLPVAGLEELSGINFGRRTALTTLALSLACRFKEDNFLFDPVMFLNACSPNVKTFPLGELWENDVD